MGLTLAKSLRLIPRGPSLAPDRERPGASVAFVGAGGKTTSAFSLARELGRPTLVTTTTHLGAWQAKLADRHIIATSTSDLATIDGSGVTLVTGPAEAGNRLSGPTEPVLLALHEFAQRHQEDLIIEADGGRQKPLKAPGPREPQIPDFVSTVVVSAGLKALGMPLDDNVVHRPDIFATLTHLSPGEVVSPEAIVRVLMHPEGGLKGIPPHARRVALLNQADDQQLQAAGNRIGHSLLGTYDAIIVASMQDGRIHAVHEPCAGIVLAAGAATRFGSPKQVALWRGEPLVRIAGRSALEAGLSPVVVVTGAYADQVNRALAGLPVSVAHNPAWQEGQGSSVRCGVATLPPTSAGAVFLLADQPFVNAALIGALVAAHSSEDAAIVAPLIQESQRGNPVLFDLETFGRLLALRGDVGGRSIFSDYSIHYVPWHDASVGREIDTLDDYAQLLETDL